MAVQDPIAWGVIEDAIYDWFFASVGIPAIWARQDVPQLSYPYGVLSIISGPTQVGGSDEHKSVYDAIGDKLDVTYRGIREFTLSIQVLNSSDNKSIQPDVHPRWFLTRAQSSLSLDDVCDAFGDKGFSVLERGSVVDISIPIGTAYVQRCSLDVLMLTTSIMTSQRDFIQTVEMGINTTENFTVTSP